MDGPIYLKSGINLDGTFSAEFSDYTELRFYEGARASEAGENAMVVVDGISDAQASACCSGNGDWGCLISSGLSLPAALPVFACSSVLSELSFLVLPRPRILGSSSLCVSLSLVVPLYSPLLSPIMFLFCAVQLCAILPHLSFPLRVRRSFSPVFCLCTLCARYAGDGTKSGIPVVFFVTIGYGGVVR